MTISLLNITFLSKKSFWGQKLSLAKFLLIIKICLTLIFLRWIFLWLEKPNSFGTAKFSNKKCQINLDFERNISPPARIDLNIYIDKCCMDKCQSEKCLYHVQNYRPVVHLLLVDLSGGSCYCCERGKTKSTSNLKT